MPNIDQMFPSKYLKAGDCEEADLILTIANVKFEELGQGDKAETKPVIYFDEAEKGLVLNKTNATTIAELHGRTTEQWIGKRIAIYATEVEMGGKVSMGIRVRLRAPKAATTNGNEAPVELLTMTQARAALEAVGLTVEPLKSLLVSAGHVNAEGKPLYDPARDTVMVLRLVAAEKAKLASESPF
jgi:hypothetical protein